MDFDRIEQLLQTKDFILLDAKEREWITKHMSEAEYYIMRELYLQSARQNIPEIDVPEALKTRLDLAMVGKSNRHASRQWRMPLYQVAAVAFVFLLIGLGINYRPEVPARILTQRIIVPKYIDRPIEKVRYVKVSVPITIKTKAVSPVTGYSEEMQYTYENIKPELNPEILRQQEIAMTNIQRVFSEKNCFSMGSDTVLRKMMVTVY